MYIPGGHAAGMKRSYIVHTGGWNLLYTTVPTNTSKETNKQACKWKMEDVFFHYVELGRRKSEFSQ